MLSWHMLCAARAGANGKVAVTASTSIHDAPLHWGGRAQARRQAGAERPAARDRAAGDRRAGAQPHVCAQVARLPLAPSAPGWALRVVGVLCSCCL